MVSSRIAKNTVVNTPMHHGSFMKTLAKKWEKIAPGHFAPLTARVADAPEFTQVFTSPTARPRADWPVIAEPVIPPEFYTTDFSSAPLGDLERSIVRAVAGHPHARVARAMGVLPDPVTINTVGEAEDFIRKANALRPPAPPPPENP
jgi:hypothetical protein